MPPSDLPEANNRYWSLVDELELFNEKSRRLNSVVACKSLSSWESLSVLWATKAETLNDMESVRNPDNRYLDGYYWRLKPIVEELRTFDFESEQNIGHRRILVDGVYWITELTHDTSSLRFLPSKVSDIVMSGKGLSSLDLNLILFHCLKNTRFLFDGFLEMAYADTFYLGILICSICFSHNLTSGPEKANSEVKVKKNVEKALGELFSRIDLKKIKGKSLDLCLEPFLTSRIPGHCGSRQAVLFNPRSEELHVIWRFGGGNALFSLAKYIRQFSLRLKRFSVDYRKDMDKIHIFYLLKKLLSSDAGSGSGNDIPLFQQMKYYAKMRRGKYFEFSSVEMWYDVEKIQSMGKFEEARFRKLIKQLV